jgi:T3SS negative regulator,GrlR
MTGATDYDQGDQKRTLLDKRGSLDSGQTGVSVLRDGKMLGGGSILYHVGSYQCSDGKWKGEVTSREHTPTVRVRPFAGHIATMPWDLRGRIRTRARNCRRRRSSASEAFA